MSHDISAGFAGRTLFMTGGTGFVGKVLLFKLLSEVPDIKRVYLLCRGKKPKRQNKFLHPQQRLEQEVLESPCLEPLRQRYGKEKWAELSSRVKAINGDITLDGLGINPSDLNILSNEVQLIVHLAATVNFNEKLTSAIQMNTLGGLRALMFAKKCKKLEAMVHVSTCYVNFQRHGRENPNLEKIYPLDFDAEEMVRHVLGIHEEEVGRESKRLLKEYNFPNTYTFTKNLGEQLIEKYKGDLPVVVVRPSIIGASIKDPIPGWVDTLTAAGGLLLTTCLGVVRELNLGSELLADIIPVDYVVNVVCKALFQTQQYYKNRKVTTTVSQPYISAKKTTGEPKEEKEPEDEVHPFIYQVATSSAVNAVTWERVYHACRDLMNSTPRKHPKALSRCDVYLTSDPIMYKTRYLALRYAPYLALRAVSSFPQPIGSPEMRKNIEKLGRAVRRADLLNKEFNDFVTQEWVYDVTNSRKLDENLSEKTKAAFQFDPTDIDWYNYVQNYVYGMLKNIVKDVGELKKPPSPGSSQATFRRSLL